MQQAGMHVRKRVNEPNVTSGNTSQRAEIRREPTLSITTLKSGNRPVEPWQSQMAVEKVPPFLMNGDFREMFP